MISNFKLIFSCRVILSLIILAGLWLGLAQAQWSNDPTVNTPISRSLLQEWDPKSVSDGADGAIIVWSYYGISSEGFNISAQHIDAGGYVKWTSAADICSAHGDQKGYRIISDGSGGAIIVWNDHRSDYDIYAQRVDASGNVKWTADGVVISDASNVQAYPDLISDGAGGAIITWRDSRSYSALGVDIYAQRIDGSGVVKWASNGKAVCTASGDQIDPRIVSDGSGGAVITWTDYRDAGTTGYDIYAQRINSSGTAQWTTDGVGYKANGNQLYPTIVSDGSGGAIIAWQDDYSGISDVDIRCLRINSSGGFPWSPNSTWVCGASNNQGFPQAVTDGAGGAIIVWTDYRSGTSNPNIYIDRIDVSGVSKWVGWGKVVCNASNRQVAPKIIADMYGGAIITWMDERSGTSDIYAQRIYSNGTFAWKNNGVEISTAKNAQNTPELSLAGSCGAIITWCDLRWVGDLSGDTDWDIYAQRVFADGSLLPSIITVDVPNGGENWNVGSNRYIVWNCQNFSDPVKIEYSTDNGSTYSTISASTSNTGTYQWVVPNTPSTQCLVRISDAADGSPFDVSDATFTITSSGGAEVITVNKPNGGENWGVGTINNIVWNCQNFSDPVKIEYSTNGGASYTIVVASYNNTGSYLWTVPNTPSTNCVVKISDAADGNPFDISDAVFTIAVAGGTLMVTNCSDAGPGSLREAINAANSHAGPDTILFAIPKGVPGHDPTDGVWRIFPQSQLPAITDHQLLINGFSQAAYFGKDTNPYGPEILINGENAGQYMSGLVVRASGVTIMGLTINNFYSNGIWLDNVDGGHIRGCYVGTDFTGAGPAPNGYGIWIGNRSQFVVIAPMDTFRNVVSGNTNGGIFVADTSHHVHIIGNIIGLDWKRQAPIGNGNYGGIRISQYCDSVAVFDNWIGGNKYGIFIVESSRNLIQNNWIGVVMEHLFPGTGNEFDGIHITEKSYDNRIMNNHIWFNKAAGVHISGTEPLRNRISHNSIANNIQSGILYDSGGANIPPQPVITNATGSSVTGTAMPNATIEIYTDAGNQGEIFQGETMSNPSGNFLWTGMIQGPFNNVTVLAIDAQGNTSIFSKPQVTAVASEQLDEIPATFLLAQNYPNPFNSSTTIEFSIPKSGNVTLKVYNARGEKVASLVSEPLAAARYKYDWEANGLASGVYLYRLQMDDFILTKKLVLLK